MWKIVDFGENSKQLKWQARVCSVSRNILDVDAASKAKGKQTIIAYGNNGTHRGYFRTPARGEK